jgi:hypothetical protein
LFFLDELPEYHEIFIGVGREIHNTEARGHAFWVFFIKKK